MAIQLGQRLGPYEVLSAIGAGGMGEVYRARDSKLGRDVAIKVLPSNFVNDPERLARFQREARVLAALNHSNIATIHGLEQSGATNYLVMELVSGETLAERIKAGPLPIEEVASGDDRLRNLVAFDLPGRNWRSDIHGSPRIAAPEMPIRYLTVLATKNAPSTILRYRFAPNRA